VLAVDEDEVCGAGSASGRTRRLVIVRSASVDACVRHACFHAKAAESSLHARCLVLVQSGRVVPTTEALATTR
jgi:hypothetical protein